MVGLNFDLIGYLQIYINQPYYICHAIVMRGDFTLTFLSFRYPTRKHFFLLSVRVHIKLGINEDFVCHIGDYT